MFHCDCTGQRRLESLRYLANTDFFRLHQTTSALLLKVFKAMFSPQRDSRTNFVKTKTNLNNNYEWGLPMQTLTLQCLFTCFRTGIFCYWAQSVDGVDHEVLLQGEVGQPHTFRAVNHKHNIQGTTSLFTIWNRQECFLNILQQYIYLYWKCTAWESYHSIRRSLWCSSWHHIPEEKKLYI